MLTIYFAAPLFSDAERTFNELLVHALEEFASVFLPQRDGYLITNLLQQGMSQQAAKAAVFRADFTALRNADLIIAILDGRSIDEGVAVELGLAFGLGKPCWSLKTDFRSLSTFGDNPMVEALLTRSFTEPDRLIEEVRSLSERGREALECGGKGVVS